MTTQQDEAKRQAADYAAALVEDGMVVGLGTGSTAAHFIDALIERSQLGLSIACIPSSERSAAQATEGGLTIVDFSTHPRIDLTVDGADEISRARLDLIKGLGGALLREKIVARASARLVIIADATKLVDELGVHTPVPVEVVRFGWQTTRDRLAALGARVTQRMAQPGTSESGASGSGASEAGMPYLTDGGNLILDCHFGAIDDPAALAGRLALTTGVVEHGLFVGMASLALIADAHGVHRHAPR